MQIMQKKIVFWNVKEMMIVIFAFKIVFVAYLNVKQGILMIILFFAVLNHFVIYLMEHFLHHHLVSNDVDIFSASNFL